MCSLIPLRFDCSCGCNISSHFSMAVVGSNPGVTISILDRKLLIVTLSWAFWCLLDVTHIPSASCWSGYHGFKSRPQVVDRDTTRKTLSRWHSQDPLTIYITAAYYYYIWVVYKLHIRAWPYIALIYLKLYQNEYSRWISHYFSGSIPISTPNSSDIIAVSI